MEQHRPVPGMGLEMVAVTPMRAGFCPLHITPDAEPWWGENGADN